MRPGPTPRRCALATAAVALLAAMLVAPAGAVSVAGAPGCEVAPAASVWRTPVASLPVASDSAQMIAAIGAADGLHADFGSGLWDGGPIGIPVNVVSHSQPRVHVTFLYASESDRVGYPIPAHPLVEGGAHATGTVTCSCSIGRPAPTTSCGTHTRSHIRGTGGRVQGPSSISARMRSAQPGSRPLTPPGWQSSRAWFDPRRSPRA